MIDIKEKKLAWLNVVAFGSFVLYAIGIYVQVVFQGIIWGNVVVNFALQVLGAGLGVMIVAAIGIGILFTLFILPKLHVIDVFLCFFWILSLYQCAINSFLQFAGMPDEPVNQFFKILFPTAWYPVKEVVFIVASVGLTMLWMRRVARRKLVRYEIILIIALSSIMIVATALSQVMFLNN
nr:hypothetical protein [Candidatus Sigynarchaeota archaeon]